MIFGGLITILNYIDSSGGGVIPAPPSEMIFLDSNPMLFLDGSIMEFLGS